MRKNLESNCTQIKREKIKKFKRYGGYSRRFNF